MKLSKRRVNGTYTLLAQINQQQLQRNFLRGTCARGRLRKAPPAFNEKELADLTLAIAAIGTVLQLQPEAYPASINLRAARNYTRLHRENGPKRGTFHGLRWSEICFVSGPGLQPGRKSPVVEFRL